MFFFGFLCTSVFTSPKKRLILCQLLHIFLVSHVSESNCPIEKEHVVLRHVISRCDNAVEVIQAFANLFSLPLLSLLGILQTC